jgi:hypothetical protein
MRQDILGVFHSGLTTKEPADFLVLSIEGEWGNATNVAATTTPIYIAPNL